ncbi:hypothetical protein SAMN05216345_104408 [Cupriavidus sp. YR651]|uniref:DUF5666 domain-containing protein n=1 Tax=Cupriavidus sp. YR651 TaxID=1855315 RepID=UPI000884C199|nr:hypothetical protein SAMN05216345_104408 [Cupriavidus sp. YR651]
MSMLQRLSASGAIASAMLVAMLATPASAHAQSAMRGQLVAVSGDQIKVRTREGKDVDVALTKDTVVRGVENAEPKDIASGSYIGTAAMPQADGSLRALEVHVFPPSLAGSGAGHRPWDLRGNSSMTNGTVGNVVVSHGRTITVKYPEGEKTIVVPPEVPVVKLEPGDRSLLKTGTNVVLFANKQADGTLVARAISAGKNGVVPPM